jgi:hypothetical protein
VIRLFISIIVGVTIATAGSVAAVVALNHAPTDTTPSAAIYQYGNR